MTTSLSQRQSLIRAAIARLEAGADVPDEKAWWTRDEVISQLRGWLADHELEGRCLDGHECEGVAIARLVLGEPEGDE